MASTELKQAAKKVGLFLGSLLMLAGAYFLIEVFGTLLLKPETLWGLAFGSAWSLLLAGLCLLLPRTAGRVFFGITYYFYFVWTLAQTGYYRVFSRMLWISDVFYASEGAGFLGDVLSSFSALWWIGGILLLGLGVLLIFYFPKTKGKLWYKVPCFPVIAAAVAALCLLPEAVFLRDLEVWGTRSEYGQSSSYRATYNTMYDAKNVYHFAGLYQLTFRDLWIHELYPLTPAYQTALQNQTERIDAYFANRTQSGSNEMTGAFAGKNVVLVLMESMDDWMITPEDTPTLYWLMEKGINFTQFYTPGYGTARTINTEFCMNTGIYLPTNGKYVFDYVTNDFGQSIASQLRANGYSAEAFHYNTQAFYSRGVFEPAMGYNVYNSYGDYVADQKALYDDCLLFKIPQLREQFFRQGSTFNTIITRSAHLSYTYNEVLSYYALKQYPEYRGKYPSQEEDCARVKAKLVDDMFARLLEELETEGQLENTVIIGITDHYTYGYKNLEELYSLSGTNNDLLLEKTPCFVWSLNGPDMEVDKTLSTADFLPTMLNLLGIDSPYQYLGQDAFEPSYEGYVLFANGSWISDGVVCRVSAGGTPTVEQNSKNKVITEEYLQKMAERSAAFVNISNLLLTSDYYGKNP